jgi:hypothetical protein
VKKINFAFAKNAFKRKPQKAATIYMEMVFGARPSQSSLLEACSGKVGCHYYWEL